MMRDELARYATSCKSLMTTLRSPEIQTAIASHEQFANRLSVATQRYVRFLSLCVQQTPRTCFSGFRHSSFVNLFVCFIFCSEDVLAAAPHFSTAEALLPAPSTASKPNASIPSVPTGSSSGAAAATAAATTAGGGEDGKRPARVRRAATVSGQGSAPVNGDAASTSFAANGTTAAPASSSATTTGIQHSRSTSVDRDCTFYRYFSFNNES